MQDLTVILWASVAWVPGLFMQELTVILWASVAWVPVIWLRNHKINLSLVLEDLKVIV